MLGNGLILVHRRVEDSRQRMFGNVVLRGTQTSRNDNHLGLRVGTRKRLLDLLGIVADGELLHDGYASTVEVFGYAYGVGIDDLSNKYLIADCYNCCSNHLILCFVWPCPF